MTPDGKLLPDIARDLTFQGYQDGPQLQDVRLLPLKTFADLDGSITEIFRLEKGWVETPELGLDLRQLTVATATPFRINAFHLHPRQRQDEVWTVLSGSLKVWLVDTRENSGSAGAQRCYHLSAEQPTLLFVPWGVAHGYQAGHQGALILYAMNAQFDKEDPNEARLPWDYFGAELWTPDRG